MNCPECKSENVEFAGQPLVNVGKVVYGKRCKQCGHFWSDEVAPKPEPAPLPKLTAPAPAADLQGVPPAPPPPLVIPPAAPPAAGKGKGKAKGQKQP